MYACFFNQTQKEITDFLLIRRAGEMSLGGLFTCWLRPYLQHIVKTFSDTLPVKNSAVIYGPRLIRTRTWSCVPAPALALSLHIASRNISNIKKCNLPWNNHCKYVRRPDNLWSLLRMDEVSYSYWSFLLFSCCLFLKKTIKHLFYCFFYNISMQYYITLSFGLVFYILFVLL